MAGFTLKLSDTKQGVSDDELPENNMSQAYTRLMKYNFRKILTPNSALH
ncbi:hypothetical protein J2Y45_000128 [Dyadobacter sp. BE34]|uniref:Uncharacterized protein n=1 Tax=Dyadobacter fermentans TaxID=94254 RepID=A0ABU1R8X9_9BACT|nr:hypothetical protein [Dyadobacter fermentans]MDR7047031.1 hypothetical protein [Dyadobacter sp. BE242]MDR7195002.1 hypothetical protein [Dyadobacter sp. BE34]MDR7214453.1 hypothetical protein [Dyadobacter sp. BE31]MDR7266924.1 hypothetical protein [Dyadobacter sp. BE32]